MWYADGMRSGDAGYAGGLRGQRVVWSMVHALLLTEARQRGHGVYSNVLSRVNGCLEGGRVLTKGALWAMLDSEDRVLVNQLSTIGRQVRSTPMQWAYEGRKLDATVRQLSWVPPWVGSLCPE